LEVWGDTEDVERKGKKERDAREKRWTGPGRKKVVAGKLDPFYHFNTHPDTGAKTDFQSLSRRAAPAFPNPEERPKSF